jgi:chorismate mutase
MRGIRGAITVEENSQAKIYLAVRLMVVEMTRMNHITPADIGAAIFSATEDLTAAFPAAGARAVPGFENVPLFDTRQMAVEGGLPKCIRALFLVDKDVPQTDIHHVYLGGAIHLRPDLRI